MASLTDSIREALEKRGLFVEERFQQLLEITRATGQTLDRALVSSGYLTEKQMLEVFGEVLGIPVRDRLADVAVPPIFVERVPVHFARAHDIVAIAEANGTIQAAICQPLETAAVDELGARLDRVVEPVLAPRAEITALINKAYRQKQDVVEEMLEGVEEDELAGIAKEVEKSHDLLDIANKAPIVKLVNMTLFQALKMRASDVHIQPYEDALKIRFRIDGKLYDIMSPPKKLQDAILSRVKIMGKMDIAERRLPQDGRATVKLGDAEVDIRISSVPTMHGERIVMRLLDKTARLYELEELGLDRRDDLEKIKRLIGAAHGIVLVTGPTGSGKSTTLYAALKRLNSAEENIMTIEDPVEYHLPGISQIEVNTKKGLTFALGLRHILRQDPDIVMVGEIRDLETATIAIQAALTGHLVFSTLHTNDAPGAVTRLLDLGVEPFLVASSVIGVVAQRLVRMICTKCKTDYTDCPPQLLRDIGLPPEKVPPGRIKKGAGCPNCLNSGYYDRKAIFEIMMMDDAIREMVMKRAGSTTIKQYAISKGMKTLRMDGARKVLQGITTPEEVVSVTQMDTL
jgi:general secretion pathway protein E